MGQVTGATTRATKNNKEKKKKRGGLPMEFRKV
jgi:hypothetical protein